MDYSKISNGIPLLNYSDDNLGNIYEFALRVSKRANQVDVKLKESFDQKVKDYTCLNDEYMNDSDIDFINERTYITRLYEKTPKAYIIAMSELFQDELVTKYNYDGIEDDEK
ncbi:MAG: hypothetical protein LBD32_00160 [Cytophagales bacterium]|jgi:hypothetical protein|nr:hypothetical protein [Cytophagales bacterium]